MRKFIKEFFIKQSAIKSIKALKLELKKIIHKKELKLQISNNIRSFQSEVRKKRNNFQIQRLKIFLVEKFRFTKSSLTCSFSLARRNVTRSQYRSILLIFGIFMTIALETGIVVSIDTLYDDFIFDNRNQNFTDITVSPHNWPNLTNLIDVANSVRKVSGVSRAGEVYWLHASQIKEDQIILGNILIYGINSKTHPDFQGLNVTEGQRKISDNIIMVSERLKEDSGYDIGSSLNIRRSDFGNFIVKDHIVTLGGAISDKTFLGNNLGSLFILMDINTLYDIFSPENRSDYLRAKVDVSVDNILKIRKIAENIQDEVGLEHYVWKQKDISEIEAVGIRSYQTAMNLVILASFVVEFLFITNILAIAIRDRSIELGILRAIGIKAKQLIVTITIEILIYAVIGSIFGIIFGIGLAIFLIKLMEGFYPKLDFQSLSLHFSSLSATFASGIIVALISGLYPIFISISMPIIQNIHTRIRSGKKIFKYSSYWKYTAFMGISLSITGFILQFYIGPSRFLDFELLSIHFMVVFLIFCGTLLFEVAILVILPKIAKKALFFVSIIIKTISTRNIAREFQKSLFTIMTSALALSFIITVGLVSSAIITAVPGYFQDQWGRIDLVAEARDGMLSTDSTRNIESYDRVRSVSYIQEQRTSINGLESYIFGVDPLKYRTFAEDLIDSQVPGPSYFFLNQSVGSYTTNVTYGLVSDILFQRIHTQIGGNVSLLINNNNTVNITVAAVIKSNIFLGNGEYMYISTNRFQEFFNSTFVKWFICDIDGDLQIAKRILENAFPEFIEVIPIDFYAKAIEESLTFQSAIFQVLFIESFILAAFAQFICILVSTLHMEREMGIMRAIGLHKKGVLEIFVTESITLGITALIIGIINGLLGSLLLAWYISLSIPVQVKFPIDKILLWVFVSFLITLMSTILPSYRSSQKSIVAAISGKPLSKQYKDLPEFHSLESLPREYYLNWSSNNPITINEKKLLKSKVNHGDKDKVVVTHYQIGRTTIRRFINEHQLEIQTAFLVILAIFTVNYIFDGSLIIRGILLSDIIWDYSLYYSTSLLQNSYITHSISTINPFLFCVGFAAISPISYYIINKTTPRGQDILLEVFKGLIIGFFAFCVITIINIIFFASILYIGQLIINPDWFQEVGRFLIIIIAWLIIIGLNFLIFQKFLVYMIFRGLKPDLNLKQTYKWILNYGSKGYLKISGIIIIQIILNALLTLLLNREVSQNTPNTLINPIEFLIISSFQIGFYLFLIIFQLVQFQNQLVLYKPNYPLINQNGIISNKT